ncbi:sigma-54-dependent Fis family transcriptional regulator [Algiphilus sp. NNCM1]|uniref:sigma-54-dependent transcriptional regulator n=1 Tax=Algiphilus sp. TaxID=1872431 RepID=UPI001CA661EF|nr:sigma-54 dependent transcriptional regulator [Algiphilus sp.]MBY8965489.1 sigma-54-dependent Fis family transcriptional regulator [Algiphilus acroporae]MCI5061962.1 sigma-54 dependent transcriptional regulator [Algiphilus sp.]MCI5103533.1 sigma-54 dependent transcriptional regulator [Algiphilus sp.]
MSRARVLVVDDEQDIRDLLGVALARMELEAVPAETVDQARRLLGQQSFRLCLTDMRLPDGNGIQLVETIQQHYPGLPVAVITAYGNAQAAVDSLKAGAFDFVSKPLQLEDLRRLVDDALKLPGAGIPEVDGDGDRLIGDAPAMQQLRALISRVARSQAPLHISGESGTGKERVARLVHQRSARKDGPFVPVNCGAIPSELMESELFGHIKGAFTGALQDNEGLFRAAEGGTLFLDEVAELPLPMQVKLLRAIQERVVRPVGARDEQPVNVRIISATNLDLAQCVSEGRFRQDLYYRLNVVGVRTPALRQHPEDIPQLADYILEQIARQHHCSEVPLLTEGALRRLVAHPFPGNVRELENILERAVTLCEGSTISEQALQLQAVDPAAALASPSASPAPAATPSPAVQPTTNHEATDGGSLESRLQNVERQAIIEALEATRWNRTRAAEKLGLSFRQLRYKIRKLGIE